MTVTETIEIKGNSLLSGVRRNETRTYAGKITNFEVSSSSFSQIALAEAAALLLKPTTVVGIVYKLLEAAGLIGNGGINDPYLSGPDGKTLTFHYWTQAFTAYDIQINVTHEEP
jgi:hypothetical protein